MTDWNAVRVFAGSELEVSARMSAAGVDAYCPSFRERRRNRYGNRGVIVSTERPLFPGWMFARIDSGFRTQAFERGRCKITVFRQSRLDDSQIEAVRSTAVMMTGVSDRTKIVPGAFVELWRGVLKGESAQVLMTRGQMAAIALLSSGKVLRVSITDLENVSRERMVRLAV
jgi:transcription antitermination factor NusG